MLKKISFSDIDGWELEDHAAALACFRVSARRMSERPYTSKALGINAGRLAAAGEAALRLAKNTDSRTARRFFEDWFRPFGVAGENTAVPGFVTGYFEPEIRASKTADNRFRYPVLKRPADLVSIDDTNRPKGMDEAFFFARKNGNILSEYPDRRAIENGALDGLGLELFWFESRIDVFFIHIQGSARLVMRDGSLRRISYAGKSGHPFTAIGKLLVARGELTAENATMQTIRGWLEDHREKANELMWENRSFIFFQEVAHPDPDLGPVAAASVPLTPGRSLAVDHRLHTFGTPIWVETQAPLPDSNMPYRRLMIAQDTGSAIVGPARGDLFIGSGFEAGEIAGRIKHDAAFVVLVPAEVSPNGEIK